MYHMYIMVYSMNDYMMNYHEERWIITIKNPTTALHGHKVTSLLDQVSFTNRFDLLDAKRSKGNTTLQWVSAYLPQDRQWSSWHVAPDMTWTCTQAPRAHTSQPAGLHLIWQLTVRFNSQPPSQSCCSVQREVNQSTTDEEMKLCHCCIKHHMHLFSNASQ